MNDENKPDNIDDGDDLLSDFNDLFPEEDDDNLNELDAGDEGDDLESLLDGLDAPSEGDQESESDSDEEDIDALLDSLDESINDVSTESPEADAEDNLDSLLDGLEEQVEGITTEDGDDDEEGLDNLLDEMIEETKPAEEREFDLDDHELDISIDGDDESEPEALISTDDESEQSVDSSGPDDNSQEGGLDELISSEEPFISGDEIEIEKEAAAPTAATTTTTTTEKDIPPADSPSEERSSREGIEKSPSNMGTIAVYLLLFIAVGVAGGSLWMTLQAQQAVDNNGVILGKLQKQQDLVMSDLGTPYNPLVEQNSSAIRDFDQRLNELSKMVDGPLSHMNASTGEETIGRLEERLVQLEQKMTQQLAELKEELAKRPTVVAATTAPPLLIQSPKSSSKPVNVWALNLLSLTSRKGANDTVKRLQKAGVDASRTRFIAKDGKTWFRVRVIGFNSYATAKSYAKEMPKVKGIRQNQSWVTPE